MNDYKTSNDITNYKKDHVLFIEGESSSLLYILLEGEVGIFKHTRSRLIPISIIRPKSFIGELAILTNSVRSSSAIAITDCKFMIIKKSEMQKALNGCPDWVSKLVKALSKRLVDSVAILGNNNVSSDIRYDSGRFMESDIDKYYKLVENHRKNKNIK